MPSQDVPNPQAAYVTGDQGPTLPYAGEIIMQFIASAAITQYHICAIDATGLGSVYTCTASLNCMGIAQNTAAIGGTVDVMVSGISPVICGSGGITLQTGVGSDSTGRGVAATTLGLNVGTAITTQATTNGTGQVWVSPY